MLLFHAPVILAAVLLDDRGLVQRHLAIAAAIGFAAGAMLFAADLARPRSRRACAVSDGGAHGGTILIASWILLALAGLVARQKP